MGQSESDNIFVSAVKAKELVITGSSMLPFLFQWKIKMWIFSPWGSLNFGIQNQIPSDLLNPYRSRGDL